MPYVDTLDANDEFGLLGNLLADEPTLSDIEKKRLLDILEGEPRLLTTLEENFVRIFFGTLKPSRPKEFAMERFASEYGGISSLRKRAHLIKIQPVKEEDEGKDWNRENVSDADWSTHYLATHLHPPRNEQFESLPTDYEFSGSTSGITKHSVRNIFERADSLQVKLAVMSHEVAGLRESARIVLDLLEEKKKV